MKLHLEATSEELAVKASKLAKAVTDLIRPADPELAESLEKALPKKEQELKYPVLRGLQQATEELYAKQVQAMLKEIGKVLDQGLAKEEAPKEGPGLFGKSLDEPDDFTKEIADRDSVAYRRIKEVLVNRGWKFSDFDEGGPFYGWSVNQLLDFARGKDE